MIFYSEKSPLANAASIGVDDVLADRGILPNVGACPAVAARNVALDRLAGKSKELKKDEGACQLNHNIGLLVTRPCSACRFDLPQL